MLSKVSEHTISFDPPRSVETLLAKYAFVSDVYTTFKQDEAPAPHRATYSVWELSRPMTAKDVDKELATRKMRPATCEELLVFADAHPEVCDPALVATGSCEVLRGHAGVPVVTIVPGGTSRADEIFAERFSAGRHVLAVKTTQTPR